MGQEVVENGNTPADTEKPSTTTKPLHPLQLLQSCLSILEKAVHMKDVRLITGRLLRQTATARQQLTAEMLTTFANSALPDGAPLRTKAVASLSQAGGEMETDGEAPAVSITTCSLPEAEAYVALLVITYLIDQKQYQEAAALSSEAVARLDSFNRRTMDGLASRIYFYYAWAHERIDQLASVQSKLLALHQLAVLRHDEYCQETLLNLLIRSFLHYNLYEQAEQLRAKAQRPEVDRSSQQMVRHLFYHGRICAIQLNYSDAKDLLSQALRKAPTGAQGFRNTATKWLTLVRLLLGEVPAHQDFKGAGVERSLEPYFQLSQAVRLGDLISFKQVAEKFESVWAKDRTHNLVVRLRHNVIRAGLYRISLAYWRISLADVAAKLGLPSVKDTEYIVAKAIRDGGIDAEIDHEQGWITSRATPNTYSTNEPQLAFHRRVAFCMDLHNEAVKAMRFEEAGNKKSSLDTADTARERQKMIEEDALAAEEDGDF